MYNYPSLPHHNCFHTLKNMNSNFNYLISFLVLVILAKVECQGGGGGNFGPIFDSHPETMCQDKIFPHYPVVEDWINGDWVLSYLYQEVEKQPVNCSSVNIQTDENNYNKTITADTVLFYSGSQRRTLTGYKSGIASPARFNIQAKRDGLVADGAKYFATLPIQTLTFLSFTSGLEPDQRTHYETALYVVCYQGYVGETYSLGVPRISEIGILSRNGVVATSFFDHYNKTISSIAQLGGLGLPPTVEFKATPRCPT